MLICQETAIQVCLPACLLCIFFRTQKHAIGEFSYIPCFLPPTFIIFDASATLELITDSVVGLSYQERFVAEI